MMSVSYSLALFASRMIALNYILLCDVITGGFFIEFIRDTCSLVFMQADILSCSW